MNVIFVTFALRVPPLDLSSCCAFFRAGPSWSPFSRRALAAAAAVALLKNFSQLAVISALAAAGSAGAVASAVGVELTVVGVVEPLPQLLLPPHPAATRRTGSAARTAARRTLDMRRPYPRGEPDVAVSRTPFQPGLRQI